MVTHKGEIMDHSKALMDATLSALEDTKTRREMDHWVAERNNRTLWSMYQQQKDWIDKLETEILEAIDNDDVSILREISRRFTCNICGDHAGRHKGVCGGCQ